MGECRGKGFKVGILKLVKGSTYTHLEETDREGRLCLAFWSRWILSHSPSQFPSRMQRSRRGLVSRRDLECDMSIDSNYPWVADWES